MIPTDRIYPSMLPGAPANSSENVSPIKTFVQIWSIMLLWVETNE